MADSPKNTADSVRPSFVGSVETKAHYGWTNVPDEELAKHISPAGQLGLPSEILPPLLDLRRVEYYCPDKAFRMQPAVDTVHVWQIGLATEGKYTEGGAIIMSEVARDQERNESPYGIIIAAGLLARDQLRSHGIDLGHVVYMLRMSPYRIPVGYIAGRKNPGVLVMHAGDIKGSEDTMRMLKSGAMVVRRVKEKTGAKDANGQDVEIVRHVYVHRDSGEELVPIQPWAPQEV